MTESELIVRLVRELYDLKQKLEDIRKHADIIYRDSLISSLELYNIISILNLLDCGEVYED